MGKLFFVEDCSCYFGGDSTDLVEGAGQILSVLNATYPGHHIKVYGHSGGVFHIVHLDFEQLGGNWGMALKGRKFYSASHMRNEVVTKFGEWLERANLKRGKANGDGIVKVEGVPERNHREELDIPKLIEAGRKAAQENNIQIVKQEERQEPWRQTG